MSVPNRVKLTVAGLGVAGAVALGLTIPSMAAAEPGTSPSGTSAAETPAGSAAQAKADRQRRLAEGLATELGLPVDQVTAALTKVQAGLEAEAKTAHQARLKERLQAAVTAGTLTQAQAD